MHYVLSDIHGNERRFQSILDQIELQPEDTLYVLGDVIDRHRWGLRILRRLMAMPNAELILGNHEYMMLRALGEPLDENVDDGNARAHWYRNGGGVTHRHWKRLRKSLRREIVEYLHSLPLNRDIEVDGRRYLLVHGAPEELWARNEDPRYLTKTHFAVWNRLKARFHPGVGIPHGLPQKDHTEDQGHDLRNGKRKPNQLQPPCLRQQPRGRQQH